MQLFKLPTHLRLSRVHLCYSLFCSALKWELRYRYLFVLHGSVQTIGLKGSLMPYIVTQVNGSWKCSIMQVFSVEKSHCIMYTIKSLILNVRQYVLYVFTPITVTNLCVAYIFCRHYIQYCTCLLSLEKLYVLL